MASRVGELSRSSGGHAPTYSLSPATSRREFGSQGGSRPGHTADLGELGADSGWHVVDARNGRSGRSWPKLFKQLTKLLDDIYLTCELDCSLAHVATMVEYLEVSAGDFAQLNSQLESVVSPSGQKVAWEVRACRRASNRSSRIGLTAFGGSGGGGGGGGGGGARAQGPISAGAAAAAAAAGPGSGSGTGQITTAPAAAAVAAGPAATSSPVVPPPLPRALALLGVRRAASCGGASPGAGGENIAGLPPPPVGVAASEGVGGTAAAAAAGGAGGAPRAAGSRSGGPAPGAGASGPSLTSSAAADGNPWKGKVNWNELFGRPQQPSQAQQKQQQPKPGISLQGGSTAAVTAVAAGEKAAAVPGSGPNEGHGDVFRLGTAPPPPRIKTTGASGGGGGGSGSGSGEGSCSPTGGPASPLDSLYHKMLSSPSRKLSPSEVRRASEERHARAEKARQALAEERLARLAQANQSRQTVKSIMEERAGAMAARVDSKIARSAELRQAHLAERVQKAVEETKKVAEVAFINQMLEQDKKLALQEKLEEGETRRRQALEALQQRGKGAAAAVEEAQERRKLLEAERREQLADRQRRKEAAQAKLEEERRAAAAAREAASRAQRAAAAQVAEARQRLRDVLSVRIEERLREAAARRAQHLELIKERAALGKDLYDRRTLDGNTTSPRSPQSRYTRPPSPEVASAGAAGGSLQASPLPLPPPPLGRLTTLTAPGGGGGGGGSGPRAWLGGASSAAGAIAAAAAAAAGGQPPPSSPSGLHSATSHAGAGPFAPEGSGPCGSPLRSSDRSITLSADPRKRLKGMRRRACKTLARLEAARPDYFEPPHLVALLEGPDGVELVTTWAQLVEAARRDTAAAAADTAATAAAAGKAARRKGSAGGGAAAAAGAAPGSAAAAALAASPGSAVESNAAVASVRGSSGGSSKGGAARPGAGGAGASGRASCGGALAAPAGPGASAAAASVKHLLLRVHTDLGGRSKGIALHAARPSGLLAALAELLTAPAAAAASHPPQTSVQLVELLALLVTSSPHNTAWLLARCGGASLAGLVRCGMRALDRYNGLAADEVWEEPPEARYLAALLQTLACLCRTPFAEQPSLHAQQEELVAYVVACGLIHRSTELFSLFDQPAANDTAPIPGYVLQCLALLEAITGGPRRRTPAAGLTSQKRWLPPAANGAAIALAFQETSMAGLPSLLTAVLLRAAPSCTPAEARPERLPPNFVEAAACVMRVLNNIARLDLVAAQSSLGASDLRVVFFHLVGFLLSYCTNQWPTGRGVEPAIRAALNAAAGGSAAAAASGAAGAPGSVSPAAIAASRAMSGSSGGSAAAARGSPATAQPPLAAAAPPPAATGLVQLLNEVLLLIGFYGVLQPTNQDVLLWGKSPTILQRLAEVPFPYWVEQQLYQVLMPTLLSVCYGSERACATLAQHMDPYLLQSYLQAMIRQFHFSPSTPASGIAVPTHGSTAVAGAQQQPGSSSSSPSSPSRDAASADAAAAAATGAAPASPRRLLLHDLPSTVSGMPGGAGGVGSGGGAGESEAGSLGADRKACSRSAFGATWSASGDDALALPPPTADRYSLPQRFPPELLPQVLAFLERQMPGATERAGSAESSLAAAVAAAAAAGRLTAAPPQLSSSPLAVLAVNGSGKKAATAATKKAAPGAGAYGGRANGGGGGGDGEALAGDLSATTAPGHGAGGQTQMDRDVGETAAAARPSGMEAAEGATATSAETHGSFSTPIGKAAAGGVAQHHASGGAATDSPSVSASAGVPGTGSSGRAASSSGSYGYSHHHFRRFLDAADVPVPFAAGARRRHKLIEAAAAAAVAAAAAAAAEGGVGSAGCGSADANNCARSYVSELSFAGAYLTPSLQGDSREGDPRSPGEDERLVLDEFDLEQYEQQRLCEQQHLDEQDVLLLDEPSADGGSGDCGRPAKVGRKQAASRSAGGSAEDPGGGSPPDLGTGLLAAKKAKGRPGNEKSGPSAAPSYEVPASMGGVMDAWWRRIGHEYSGVDAGSGSESPTGEGNDSEGDGEGMASTQAASSPSPSMS